MILFSDIDGTLWRHSDKDYSELRHNMELVSEWRKAGNLFAVATGRGFKSVQRLLGDYLDEIDYYVTDNGAYVFNNRGELLKSNCLCSEIAGRILDVLNNTIPRSEFEISYYSEVSEAQFPSENVGKIRIWMKGDKLIDGLCAAFSSEFGDSLKVHYERHAVLSVLPWISSEFTAFVNVVSAEAGKELAIDSVVDMLGLSKTECVMIGDDLNDFDAMKMFDGYIMKDANFKLLEFFPPERCIEKVSDLIEALL